MLRLAPSAIAYRVLAARASPALNRVFVLKNQFRADSTAERRLGPQLAWRNQSRQGVRFSRPERTPSATPMQPELDHHRGCDADASIRPRCLQNWTVQSYKQIAGLGFLLRFPRLLRWWKQEVGGRFQFLIKPPLPVAQALPVEQGEGFVPNRGGDRQISFVQVGDQPVIKLRHLDFLCSELLDQPGACFALLVIAEPFR